MSRLGGTFRGVKGTTDDKIVFRCKIDNVIDSGVRCFTIF